MKFFLVVFLLESRLGRLDLLVRILPALAAKASPKSLSQLCVVTATAAISCSFEVLLSSLQETASVRNPGASQKPHRESLFGTWKEKAALFTDFLCKTKQISLV